MMGTVPGGFSLQLFLDDWMTRRLVNGVETNTEGVELRWLKREFFFFFPPAQPLFVCLNFDAFVKIARQCTATNTN